MRPTRRLTNRAGLAVREIQLVVAVIGVRLQNPLVTDQMGPRKFRPLSFRPTYCNL
jgi:hypothetical protein